VSVDPLNIGDDLFADSNKMAEMLNSFFCSVFTSEDNSHCPAAEVVYEDSGHPFSQGGIKDEEINTFLLLGPDTKSPPFLCRFAWSLWILIYL
jgi:hypothetical protein